MGAIKGFTPKQKDAILAQANDFWEASTRMMEPFFTRVNEYERLARCLLPEALESVYAKYPDRACLVPPDIHNNINSLRAYVRAVVFKKKPYFRLFLAGQPGLRDERIEKAEQVLQQIKDLQSDGLGFQVTADKAIYQALYAGLTCSFLQWVRRYERVPRRSGDGSLLVHPDTAVPQFEQKLVSQYPESKPIDIRRVRMDPSAAEKRDMRIVGVHGIRQLSDLLALNRNAKTHYQFSEKDLRDSSFQRQKYFEYIKSEDTTYSDKIFEGKAFGDQPVETWSLRGLFRIPDTEGNLPDSWEVKDLIVEIGNRDIILAIKENDLPIAGWNLFDWPAIDEQHDRLFAMGIVEPARDSFIEGFIKRNQSLDAANRNVYNTYIGDAAACDDLPDYIESANDQLLKIDVGGSGLSSFRDAIGVLERPALGQDTFQHSQIHKREVQQTMRLSDYMQGVNPASTETATAVAEVVSGGKSLTDHLMERLRDSYFAPTAQKEMVLWNFFNADKEHNVVGKQGRRYRVEPGEIDISFQVSMEISTGLTHPAMVRRLIEMYPLIANDPFTNPREVRETAFEALELPNIDQLLPPDDLIQAQIDRENAALAAGVEQPVHPLDNHQAHMEGHVQGIEEQEQFGVDPAALEDHIAEHQAYIEQQNEALGNTKGGGGLAGGESNPDSARRNQSTPSATGRYTPSEGRA